MKTHRFAYILLIIAAAFAGCATNPVTGKHDLSFMSEADEIRTGQQMHPQIVREYGAYDDPQLQAYVNDVGQRLAAKSHRPNLKYTFTVLDSNDINAFAIPGGYVYITRGIMAYLNSEAELAAVLGHEIGHIAARHPARQQSQSTLAGIGAAAIGIFTGSGDLAGLANYAGTAVIRGYGRDMELEADKLGAEYISRIGFSSQNMINVVRLLKNQEMVEVEKARKEGREPRVYHGVFATHPDNDTRLTEVVAAAQKIAPGNALDENRDGYLKHIDGLAFGSSRSQGVARESRFYHAELGFTMAFPSGWVVQNLPDRLIAISPQKDSLIQMSNVAPPPNTGPRELLGRLTGSSGVGQVQELDVNGMKAMTGVIRVATTPFGQGPARIVVIYFNNLAYVFLGASKASYGAPSADPVIMSSIKTFRRLKESEFALGEPNKIKLVRANDATRVADLARASKLDNYAPETLRLLNDLYPSKEPQPGQWVKVVQ